MIRLPKLILFASLALLSVLACTQTSIAAPVSQIFDSNGVKIHYLIEGTGEPVALIHGMDSSARLNWQIPGTIDALAVDHQVIALDLPGYGESDKPARPDAYGRQWIDDVIALLDHLNIRKAHIVGYSMGGLVALKLIAEHPNRALSGTLGGMGWMPEGGGLQRIWAHMRGNDSRGVSELALSESELKAIRVPVLILVGDRDRIRKTYVAPLQKERSDWQVIEIHDAGHGNCVLKKQFIDELEKWLNANRQK